MNGTLKIFGGNPLFGSINPVSNKNAVVAVLPLCLLTNQDCIYNNLPKTTDVEKILQMLKKLGAKVKDDDYNKVVINCKNVNSYEVDFNLGSTIRASLNFAGPLLTRFGQAVIPLPGGCTLGVRSINTHLDSFLKAGVTYKTTQTHVHLKISDKPKSLIWQTEASPTGTENLISLLAVTGNKTTVIEAAAEPHVTQVEKILVKMGANIKGISSNQLKITGCKKLSGFNFTPEPDFVDITGHIIAAAITNGKITIKNSNYLFMEGVISWLKKFNISIKKSNKDLVATVKSPLKLVNYKNSFPLANENLPKFSPKPWPGFPVDCLPAIVTLSCKTKGQILINNWMYETGLEYVNQLKQLGAKIDILDNQKIIVNGPITFTGGTVTTPDIIEATKAIFLAALADPVETVINNANFLKRRYPTIVEDYIKLGANIKIIE